jgi:hypothetical protein
VNIEQLDFTGKTTEPHTIIDLGYLVYYMVDMVGYWEQTMGLYAASEGYLLANEGVKHENKRKDFYPLYKANRKDTKDKEIHQRARDLWVQITSNDLFNIVSLDGLEGDDVCALLALKNKLAIISNDKDYLTLPGVEVNLLNSNTNRIRQDKLPKTLQHISFTHKEYLLYLTINGDSADNVPQLRNKGKKGLEELGMILEAEDSWEMAYQLYGEDLLRNLMLVILPHPSVLRLSCELTQKDVFELVKSGLYYDYVKEYGVNLF